MSGGMIFGGLCLLLAGLFVYLNQKKTKRILNSLDQMLDAAQEGVFHEQVFDESIQSALETRFAHYLSAAETSAQNVAQEKDRIKTLIADISHQTKTPIANLLLYSELLLEEELSESARANAAAVYEQADKLRFLIDALVKLSRLENGILTLAPKQAPLQPLLERALARYAPSAQAKGLLLEAEPTAATGVFDPKWTLEALENIVDNAVKYTAAGSVCMSVKEYELFVCLEVADTGIGIAESEQAKIFTRFYRSARVGEQEGVGIGLYLARQIINGEGGYVKVTSKEGQGTVFGIYLPRSAGGFLQNC